MFELGKTVVSEEILDHQFVCDLNACKGACCVDGSAGAPLEEAETQILNEIIEDIIPYLRKEGVKAIRDQGTFVKGSDGDWETPLVDNQECAYTVFSKNGTAECGIEKAHRDKAITWQKPISCHLYPVRIREYSKLTAVNYHRWQICDPACSLGAQLEIPIYKFVKTALIRKFGEDWYLELEAVAKSLSDRRNM
ncbi:MAG: DUF3109 family protein [Flavobacteriaceae bacterium]